MKGNKGEWSEFYTFIKLLADKRIYGADPALNKVEELLFPVLTVIREESTGTKEYRIHEADNSIVIVTAGADPVTVNIPDLEEKTKRIFESIQAGSKTFTIPLASELMSQLQTTGIKAGNSKKEDITLEIHDLNTSSKQKAGFSIKSMLGSAATLLNASTATNFKYKVENCTDEIQQTVNAIDTNSKVRDRMRFLKERDCSLVFDAVSSDVFLSNLGMIDTVFPKILSEYVVFYFSGKGSTLSELSDVVLRDGEVCEEHAISEVSLKHKMKGFLHAIALGMVPATPWDGEIRAHGGYIIVLEDGELVCYHVFNTDQFREYVYQNVKIDSPSVSRHGYGEVYKENDTFYINLNIQIRFIK